MLREFVASDQQAVHSYAADPVVTQFTEWGPNDVADTRAFLADVIARSGDPRRTEFTFAAIHGASGAVIGSGDIRVTDALHRRGEVGYVFDREFRLLVRFGFEHLRLRRISATCHPDNHASARVLQKAGLRYEDRMHSHLYARGPWRDSLLDAIGGSDCDVVNGLGSETRCWRWCYGCPEQDRTINPDMERFLAQRYGSRTGRRRIPCQ